VNSHKPWSLSRQVDKISALIKPPSAVEQNPALSSVWAETSNERVSLGFGETEAARMFWQRLKLFAGFCV
jgi:hypothetical protein